MDTITAEQFSAESGVDDWRASAGGAAAYFATRNFAAGASLVAAIADLAEAANHHPDIELKYRGVTVHVITHSAGGLTRKDVELARGISAAARDLGIDADLSHLGSGG